MEAPWRKSMEEAQNVRRSVRARGWGRRTDLLASVNELSQNRFMSDVFPTFDDPSTMILTTTYANHGPLSSYFSHASTGWHQQAPLEGRPLRTLFSAETPPGDAAMTVRFL